MSEPVEPTQTPLGPESVSLIEFLVGRTISLLETEYPNAMRLDLPAAPTQPITPRSVHPAFYGCYDWHSSVHSHWQIVRALRILPDAAFAAEANAVLDRTLSSPNLVVEMAWVADRPGFEMPYGMAWLLRLCRELRDWGDRRADRWLAALQPLEQHAVDRFERLCRRLPVPMRGGLHNQTAFSLGLAWDSSEQLEHVGLRELIAATARRLFAIDVDIDLRHEPSAADFLSPSLSEADLMRRVLAPGEFATWLEAFVPGGFDELEPVTVLDTSDGQLAHWAGLNLSRSWMMSSLADSLPDHHRLVEQLRSSAGAHARVGIPIASHPDYMISHWVPTFAVYLLTQASTIRPPVSRPGGSS